MPKVTEAHLESRRRQILDAALICFSRKGFHQTTMQDILKESDLSAGAVYSYFSGKEDIINATSAEWQKMRSSRFKLVEKFGASLEALQNIVAIYIKDLKNAESKPRMSLNAQLWGEALGNPGIKRVVRSTWDDFLDRIQAIVRDAQKKGEVSVELDPEIIARIVLSLYDGVMLQKLVYPDLDVEKFAETLKTLFSSGFAENGHGSSGCTNHHQG